MGRAVDHGGLVQRARDRVEEAVEQERVRAQGATEVDADQAELGVQAEDREDILNAQEQQEQGDEGQHLREHLNQQQAGQGRAAALEAEAAEGVGRGSTHEHRADRRRGGHDQGVENPRPVHGVLAATQGPVVLQGDAGEQRVRAGQRRARVQRHGQDVEQRDDAVGNRQDGDDVTPAHLRPPAGTLEGGSVVLLGNGCSAHHSSSRVFVWRKPSHAITPTTMKMTMDMAEARP